MTGINEIDFMSATMADLDTLTMDDVLGENLADIDLTSSLPDGVYLFHINKRELKRRAADVDQNKKASLTLGMSLKVVKCITCADSSVDPETLASRSHYQGFYLANDMGKQQLAKLVLGALGISWKDKAAIAEVGQNLNEILSQLEDEKVVFGAKIANKTSGQYENCDIVFKEDAFIGAENAATMID